MAINFINPKDRSKLDFDNPNTPKPYSNRLVKIASDAISHASSTTKVKAYSKLLKDVMEATLVTHEHIWIGVNTTVLQVIGVKPFTDTVSDTSNTILLICRDYRGQPMFTYGRDKNDLVAINQRIVTVACNINDIEYIQLPSVSEDLKDTINDIIRVNDKRIMEMITIMNEKKKDFNIMIFNHQYRTYFQEFNKFMSQYENNNTTKGLFIGAPEALNVFDSMWEDYDSLIRALFPVDFKESKIIPVTEEYLNTIEIVDNTAERMFTVDEMNLMLEAIGLTPIDPDAVTIV